jgi:hypothetical protein
MDNNISTEELSVTIKTIKVNNRKMTLAVFKQLPHENIINFQLLELKGQPWGRVKYYWGDQKSHHIHLVWSVDNELKRCLIEPPLSYKDCLKEGYNEYGNRTEGFRYELYEIPHGILQDTIEQVRLENKEFESKAQAAFDKYHKIYQELKSMGQLYIST